MKGAFKMDYSNGMTVVIGTEGFYAQGELRDQAITLPVSDSDLQRFLESNGLVTPMHEETYIADFPDGAPFDHPEIFAHATAEQMNMLAQQLKMADPDDLDKVEEWIDNFHTPKNITQLMNLVEQADLIEKVDFEHTDGDTPEENYAFYVLDENPKLKESIEAAGIAIDYKRTGYDRSIIDEVTLTNSGFFVNSGEAPNMSKYSPDELKELIGEEYDRQDDKGFFNDEQVGFSDMMGALRDAAEHGHDARDNAQSHDFDAR